MLAPAMAVVALTIGGTQDGARVVVGRALESRIEDGDPLVASEELRNYVDAPVLGRSFALEVEEPGSYTLELRSYFFDAYLVLRDAAGKVLAEDDDGLIGTHARIVFEVTAKAGRFRVDACALHGGRGRFLLQLARGKPDVLSPDERRKAGVEDARAGLRAVETEKGPDDLATARSLDDLGEVLQGAEAYSEARGVFERALAIREQVLGPEHPDTATSLHRLGWLLRSMGRYAEARVLFERALAIREQVLGPEHPQTATCLDNLALVIQALGDHAAARPLYERALAIREKTLGPEHPQTAWSLNNLGWLFQDAGDFEQSLSYYRRALAVQEKVLGEHADTARSLNNLANILHVLGRYHEAQELYERAVAMREAVLGPEHSDTAMSLSSLAALLRDMGKYAEARPLYERSLALTEKVLGPDHPSTGRQLGALGSLLKDMGAYGEARALYERALAIDEKALGPRHPTTAIDLENMAMLLTDMGRSSEARPLHERALAIDQQALGPEHPITATAESNLALLLHGMGSYAEALPLCERALAVRERAFGPDSPRTAISLNNVAMVLDSLGRYAEARPLLERALAIDEQTLGPEHPALATRLGNLAALLRTTGNHAEALPLCARALAIDEQVLGPDHPHTAIRLLNLGWLLQETGRPAEARALFERAIAIDEKALGLDAEDTVTGLNSLALVLADLGEHGRACELSNLAFERTLGNIRSTFPALSEGERVSLCLDVFYRMETCMTLEPPSPDQETRRTTYASVLAWKGQVVRAALMDRERTLRSLAPETRAQVQELRAVQAQVSAELSSQAAQEPGAREKRLAELRERRSALERDLSRAEHAAAEIEPAPAELLARLAPGAALVDFIVSRDYVPAVLEDGKSTTAGRWAPPSVTAWILRGGSQAIARVPLGDAYTLRAAIQDLLRLLQGERGVAQQDSSVDALQVANDRVRALLWQPLLPGLGSATRIFVSPDRFLGTLPFETVVDEDGRYLLEKLTISYVSDGATLASLLSAQPTSTGAPEDSLLAVGGVDYDARGTEPSSDGAPPASVRGSFQDYWEPLRFSRKEAETVFALHRAGAKRGSGASATGAAGDDGGSRILCGAQADEEALKRDVAGKRYIHIATHGFFQPEGLPSMWENGREQAERGPDPSGEAERITGLLPGLLSGLVCAGANLSAETGRDDGLLTAEEVTWLDLTRCDLLVLSACKTALGVDRAGEGMMSLQRAFQMAGAKSVIASLWNVDDERTVELMRDFYRHLWSEGRSRIDSLRSAQLELLARNRAAHHGHGLPWTWGAFVLYGDWR